MAEIILGFGWRAEVTTALPVMGWFPTHYCSTIMAYTPLRSQTKISHEVFTSLHAHFLLTDWSVLFVIAVQASSKLFKGILNK